MEKLVVLDYNDGSVSIWDVHPGTEINDEYVQDTLGFDLGNVYWMKCADLAVHFHKRILCG